LRIHEFHDYAWRCSPNRQRYTCAACSIYA
jgi:hypothetical protein